MSDSFSSPTVSSLRVFAYVNAEKSAFYRRVLNAFMLARDGFRLHLRPTEVRSALESDSAGTACELSEVEGALSSLCDWGNLTGHPDTAAVTTVEEFYRPRFLFQLTAEGEAAERALQWFEQSLRKPGELQTAALEDIRGQLQLLCTLAREQVLDGPRIATAFGVLKERFTSLTDRAQSFMSSLQRGMDLHSLELPHFLHYKKQLIDYLDRFIGQLVIATSEIAGLVVELESLGIFRLLEAAVLRELVDRLNPTEEERQQARLDWERRWQGLCGWFVAQGTQRAQSEVLRASARSAITQLLSTLGGINDRRVTRTDRANDFKTLARWFAECADDGQAHRLFRAAFGLNAVRHLSVDAQTLQARDQSPIPPSTSWLEAPPLVISPRLRNTGKTARPGRASNVIDRSEAKAALARLAAGSAARMEEAERRFATGTPFRLSSLGPLRKAELDLLLELLGDALSQAATPGAPVEATSADGSFWIHLTPPANREEALLQSEDGLLRTPDFLLQIRRTDEVGEGKAVG